MNVIEIRKPKSTWSYVFDKFKTTKSQISKTQSRRRNFEQKNFKFFDPIKYSGETQKQFLFFFLQNRVHIFEFKPVIYQHEKNRIFYSIKYFENVFANNWLHAKIVFKFNQPKFLTWKHWVIFFWEILKFKNLKIFDINFQLEKLRQRPKQKFSKLITYLDFFEYSISQKIHKISTTFKLFHVLHKSFKKIFFANRHG